jgi:hypothetical protein
MTSPSRTTRRLGLSVLAATLISTGFALGAAGSSEASTSAAQDHPRVLRYHVLFSPQNVIDVPPLQTRPGDYKAGDYTVFSDVLTTRSGRRVGTEGGTGMITLVSETGAQIFYSMSIKLPGGQVTASGLGSPDPHKHLAIDGGTGRFTGARGSVRVLEHGDDTGTLRITLR